MKAGTYMFFAPELFNCEGGYTFGPSTDMWALGITFFYLLTGQYPFEDAKSIFHLKELVTTRDINFELITDETARHCIKHMLDKDPKTRATIDYLLTTEWVKNSRYGKEDIDITLVDSNQDSLVNV